MKTIITVSHTGNKFSKPRLGQVGSVQGLTHDAVHSADYSVARCLSKCLSVCLSVTIFFCSEPKSVVDISGVLWRQFHRHSGLATLPSLGAIP